MSKANPLAGLIGYGDSDEESDDAVSDSVKGGPAPRPNRPPPMQTAAVSTEVPSNASAAIHPAPIAHCPWSACYDEGSGFTYYWNQNTNEVTWDAPREYLLALKVAQQHMQTAGSAEVSAEEWQLYQQALAEKQTTQNKVAAKPAAAKPPVAKPVSHSNKAEVQGKKYTKKRPLSCMSDDDEKIELITSYSNSDSESNDESDKSITPIKSSPKNKAPKAPKPAKPSNPEPRAKKKKPVVPYGPTLPPNVEYTVPIGPELPPELAIGPELPPELAIGPELPPEMAVDVKKSTERTLDTLDSVAETKSGTATPKSIGTEELHDENELLKKLKDKAMLLEKLGGEIPTDLQKIIHDENKSTNSSPRTIDMDVDNLLQEIEKKELPKIKSKTKIDIFEDDIPKSKETSAQNSPKSQEDTVTPNTPPREEFKALFPCSKAIIEGEKPISLFPSSANIEVNGTEPQITLPIEEKLPEKVAEIKEKKPNVYIMDTSEPIEKVGRKKLRISNLVLPERKKAELPSYTTKYSQHIDGFSSERTGLGFSKEDEDVSPKKVVNYGNGLAFTKGEVLNEDKKEEPLDDMIDLLDAKLTFLHQLQPCCVPPVAEMMIQMQTLRAAFTCGELTRSYWRRWLSAASEALARLEASAAPAGWTCSFARSEGRYRYRRVADGLEQWEFPVAVPTDMELSTTPPPPPQPEEPPLPCEPPPPLPATPPPPPPPQWDPPPPGCDHDTPPPPPSMTDNDLPKQEIGDELLSFYSEIGELEKTTPTPTPPTTTSTSKSNSPERPPPLTPPSITEKQRKIDDKEREGKSRKKTKVKISSSIGLKHKTVSNMVAKWQQVAEEINSD